MSHKDFANQLRKISGVTEIDDLSNANSNARVKFRFEDKYYTVRIPYNIAEDGEGGETVAVYTTENIKKIGFTDEEIAKYFNLASYGYDANEEEHITINYAYSTKPGTWPNDVNTLEGLRAYLDNQVSAVKDDAKNTDVKEDVAEISTTAKAKADVYWSTLKQASSPMAKRAGYVLEDDGNYYLTRVEKKYLCIYNPWNNDFSEYLIESTKKDADILVTKNENGDIEPTSNTLEGVFVKAHQIAQKESLILTKDVGVYERDNERYVWIINQDRFIKEKEVTPKVKTWSQVFLEARVLAESMGLMPVLTAFCIYEDADGKQYKYDIDEGKFVEHRV